MASIKLTAQIQDMLKQYMEDPVNLAGVGLSYWINTSVERVGVPVTVSILVTYLGSVINSIEGLTVEDREQLINNISEELESLVK